MPLPAYVGYAILGSSLSSVTGGLLGPVQDRASQTAYNVDPTRLPDPHAIITAFNAGIIHQETAKTLLRYLGVDWSPNKAEAAQDAYRYSWYAAGRSLLHVPSVDMAVQGYTRGLLTDAQFDSIAKRAGADPRQWDWVHNLHYNVPSAELATSAYAREIISGGRWLDLVRRSGGIENWWNEVIPTYYTSPSSIEILTFRNRGLIDNDEMDALLRRGGMGVDRHRELTKELRKAVPSISDLITMQVREAFQPQLAEELGLYDDSPKDIVKYFEWQGLNWGTGVSARVDGRVRELNWPDMYWAMHWRLISPEQLFRMHHLLRANRLDRYRKRGWNVNEVDNEFVKRLLRMQDYPPGLRDYLAAIAFQPLRLVDIRNTLMLGLQDRDWAYEQFLDRGLHPDDANVSADLAIRQVEERKKAPVRQLERNAQINFLRGVLDAYRVGLTTRDNARTQLVDSGVSGESADLWLQTIDGRFRIRTINQTLRYIRERYINGEIPDDALVSELQRAGIRDPRTQDYANLWRMERSQRSRIATTSQIQGWVRDGLMSFAEGHERLQNLGWAQADRLLLLADVNQDILRTQQRAAAAADRTRKAQARELERLAQRSQATTSRIQTELRRLTPMGKLQKWLKEDLISQQFFQTRASAMGYSNESILLHMQEALKDAGQNGQASEPPAEEEATA